MADETRAKNSVGKKALFAGALIVLLLAIGLYLFPRRTPETEQAVAPASPEPPPAAVSTEEPPVIDFNKINGEDSARDQELAQLMDERKAKFGVDKSLDMIVKGDEAIKVGDHTVSMKDIMEDVAVSRGEIVESELDSPTTPEAASAGRPAAAPEKSALDKEAPEKKIEPAGIPGRAEDKIASEAAQPPVSGETAAGTASRPDKAGTEKRIDEFGIYVVRPGDNIWNIHFRVLKEFFDNEGVVLRDRRQS